MVFFFPSVVGKPNIFLGANLRTTGPGCAAEVPRGLENVIFTFVFLNRKPWSPERKRKQNIIRVAGWELVEVSVYSSSNPRSYGAEPPRARTDLTARTY